MWLADNPVEDSNEHLFHLIGRFVLIKVIRVRNKDEPWFVINAGVLLAASRRLIFGGPVTALWLTGKRANEES